MHAQECPPENSLVLLRSQQDVDNFRSMYPNCKELYSILISGDVTDISPLSNIEIIHDRLEIRATTRLKEIKGMVNLREIREGLWFHHNDSLTLVDGFHSLRSIGNSLTIEINKNLKQISSFENLTSIGRNISFSLSDKLESVPEFNNLEYLGNQLAIYSGNVSGFNKLDTIRANAFISATDSVIGFNNLASINGDLILGGGDKVIISGFDNLKEVNGNMSFTCSIDGRCQINGFTSLENILYGLTFEKGIGKITGFDNLRTIGYTLKIITNKHLETISDFPNLKSIGSLNIFNNESLVSLPKFNALEYVSSFLSIANNKILENIDGFSQLKVARGNIFIGENIGTNLTTFPKLDTVLGSIEIKELMTLEMTDIFPNMKYVGVNIIIEQMDSLKFIHGFNSLDNAPSIIRFNLNQSLTGISGFEKWNGSLGTRLQLLFNESLQDLSAFTNVTELEGLILQRTNSISDVTTFSKLTTIGSQCLSLSQNTGLKTLDGFQNIRSCPCLFINGNDSLHSILALDSLDSEFLTNVSIRRNRSLQLCHTKPICEIVVNPENIVELYRNKQGCNTYDEVLRNCNAFLPNIQGITYVDYNCDGYLGNLDTRIPNVMIIDTSTQLPISSSNLNGEFIGILPFNAIREIRPMEIEHFIFNPKGRSIETGENIETFYEQDFGYCPLSEIADIDVSIISLDPPRPGFSHQYDICLHNIGTTTLTSNLDFRFTDEDIDQFIDSMFIDSIRMTSFEFNLTDIDIDPLMMECQRVTVFLKPTASILGQKFHPVAEVTASNIANQMVNYTDTLEMCVVGSYDPNDKMVTPKVLNYDEYKNGQTGYLEYLIRFQNEGTFPAEIIRITDSLNATIDLSTFEMIQSSHNYNMKIADNIIEWIFDDINLVHKDQNEELSKGYILFRAKPTHNLSIQDIMSNKASIFFDFNEPIVTNDAVTIFENPTSIKTTDWIPFLISPNPSSDYITIKTHKETIFNIEIISIDGHLVDTISSIGGELKYDISQFQPGLYIIRLSNNSNQNMGFQKMMIH